MAMSSVVINVWMGMRKKEAAGAGQGDNNGAVDSEDAASKGVCFFLQRATILSKRVSFLHLYTPHMHLVSCLFLLRCMLKNIFSPLQVKNKPHDGES